MPEESQETRNRRLAERWHDVNFDYFKLANESAVRYGEAAIKAMLVINGGAAVAVLAFIGGLAAQGRVEVKSLSAFVNPLMWFGTGVASASVAAGLAYFAAYCTAAHTWVVEKTFEPPFFKETEESRALHRRGRVLLVSACVALGIALLAFILGLLSVRHAVLLFG